MSQISPNPADQTTNRFNPSDRDIPLLDSDYTSHHTTTRNNYPTLEPVFPSQLAKPKGFLHHWWQGLSFRSRAIALAIAVGTISGLAVGTIATFANRSTTEQSTQTQQVRPNNPSDTTLTRSRQLPLTLVVETVVATLLLVGLIAAFLANRASRRPLLTTAINKQSVQEEPDSLAAQLAMQVGITPHQVTPEQQEADATEQLAQEKSNSLTVPPVTQVNTALDEERLPEEGAAIARTAQEEPNTSMMQLATQVGAAADQVSLLEQKEAEVEQAQLLTGITHRIRQSSSLEDLLKTTVKEVRRALKTDRVIIYGFNPTTWDGTVVAESVALGWPQLLKVKLDDPCFRERHIELYKQGRVRAIDDIHQEPGLTECHIKTLEQFAIKANLVAPILKNNQLLGLMIAHHCSEPRPWQQLDIELFAQLATQVGAAADQVSLLEQKEAEAEQAQLLTEITRRIRQSSSLEDLLKTTVKEVRRALKTDRVIIYGFNPTTWDGTVVAESVALGWSQMLRVKLNDPCFKERHVDLYKQGRVRAIDDIHQEPGLTECHIKTLEQFAIKANLVAPILKNNQLLGLMIAHHCSEPRPWQQLDIELFAQLATQVGAAADQVSFLERMNQQAS